MNSFTRLLLAALACALLALSAVPAHAATNVMVSIAPLKYFVERIGGNRVDVSIMVPAGANPATYEPKPQQMKALASTDAFVFVGVPFESAWLPRITAANRDMVMIDAQKDIELKTIEEHSTVPDGLEHANESDDEDEADHEGEEDGDGHDHAGLPDPHTWVSPVHAKTMVNTLRDALTAIDPAGESTYRAGAAAFLNDIDELHRFITGYFARAKGHEFLAFHPSWGYFADTYGLVQIAVEVDGKEPKPAELAAIIDFAKKRKIKVIYAQPQFSTRSANTIARSLGGFVIEADPLAERWLDNMYDIADKFRAAM